MKPADRSFLETSPEWKDLFSGDKAPRYSAERELPLRAELFSAHQMEEHGRRLAHSHHIGLPSHKDQLLSRLSENEFLLSQSCGLLIQSVKDNRLVAPADEWLLDNFYLIEEQIRLAKRHFPKGYSRSLPRLKDGPSADLPRVYDIALETISHSDARVDTEMLASFLTAYQTVTPLKLGELWAIPIMLRLALIENLRRVALRLASANVNRGLADGWADQMRLAAEEDPTSLILVIADMARSDPPIEGAFVAELARRLQGHGPALAMPLTWFEQRLAQSSLTIEQMVVAETQQQAADQVSVSNSISSLRTLASTNWNEFVEAISVIEKTLRRDPVGVYAHMDFPTRDRYRHSVERIAKLANRSEIDVANLAVSLAEQNVAQHATDPRSKHVGFYLIDEGLPELERRAHARLRLATTLARGLKKGAFPWYLSAILLLTTLFTAGLIRIALTDDSNAWVMLVVAVLSFICASQLGLTLINWILTLTAHAGRLPRMDYAKGIPPESRTLVAVPTMLIELQDADDLAEALEIRFLANQDRNLNFCLLTDFADASTETTPADAALLDRARANIKALNDRYAGTQRSPFFLFHRPRRWNPQEQAWMGYERKRGKLGDLNAFLRGGSVAAFSCVVGDLKKLTHVKYVITLDTDTQLPRETAGKLAGALAHPLNQAQFDPARRRVVAGYGILQPRVAVSLAGLNASLYVQLYGGDPGIDPYTNTVSDVYQDVFGEGSFIGKGIYDVDAFEASLKGQIPDNRVLSHDLLEGCYARSGLLSDVEFYEDHPSAYAADVSRRHRWIRGDWQLAAWLRRRVPDYAQVFEPNPLTALSRWKILDNLRRSLVAPATVALLILGWFILPDPWFWTLVILTLFFLPTLCVAALSLGRKPTDVILKQHLAGAAATTARHLAQALFSLTCLIEEARYTLDAILRTVYRNLISHRRLLEWRPSSITNRKTDKSVAEAIRSMWISPTVALLLGAGLAHFRMTGFISALPILVLWFLAPIIAWRLSQPIVVQKVALTAAQTQFLRKLARKTWEFFDVHSCEDDNWLIPDNIQEKPAASVAHRTSPTNIGLALLANLTAYDFGYIPSNVLLARTQATLRTMTRLERYLGHFYNWYDTQTLQALLPIYISTVDSGNLAGHLLTLAPGLRAITQDRIVHERLFEGLLDTYAVLREATPEKQRDALNQIGFEFDAIAVNPPTGLNAIYVALKRLKTAAITCCKPDHETVGTEARQYGDAFITQCARIMEDLEHLTPWCTKASVITWHEPVPVLNVVPTLSALATFDLNVFSQLTERLASTDLPPDERAWLDQTKMDILTAAVRARQRISALEGLAGQATGMARMEFGFLYDNGSRLLSIGFNLTERRRDVGLYDLLASEARLCSFVAIAQSQLPQETWFALGRQLTASSSGPVLLSWSGSMFEYLMPMLVMPTYQRTLLYQTSLTAVRQQIEYGLKQNVPWGVSESAFNALDVNLNYQYRAFGVPGLGLKRGLADDLVVAPYASTLALMVVPAEACKNLQRLADEGLSGTYGLFEAVDYTPRRQPRGQQSTIIYSFMAHHQGMSLLSLANVLLGDLMQDRFEQDASFQATLLLLQEKVPRAAAAYAKTAELSIIRTMTPGTQESSMRVLTTADTATPEVQLLSNGRYHVMVTNSGAGSSRWRDLAVTRWHEDSTQDNWGTFCYLRDTETGEFWSTAYQPTLAKPNHYEVIFTEGRAEFRRSDNDFDTHTEIVVSPEDDIELRRSHITNRSRIRRTIEITSYAELVLSPAIADALHPAFSNLFVQTEILPEEQTILCTRRGRSPTDRLPWMFKLMAVHGGHAGDFSYETDRAKFIGRGNTLQAPQALVNTIRLSGSQGSVLDPIASIRCEITLDPEESVVIDMVLGVADNRDTCLALVDKYQDRHLADRALELSWTHAQVVVRQLNTTEANTQLYARLANAIVYQNPSLRAEASILLKNRRGQSGLWSYAISGDLPIVLLRIKDPQNFDLVRELVQAHAYWRQKGLAVDLVIWNEDIGSYRQLLQDKMMGLISAGVEAHYIDRPGGIFVRPGDQISDEDRVLLQAVARASISDGLGTLAEQVNRLGLPELRVPPLVISSSLRRNLPAQVEQRAPDTLQCNNGMGGFSPDGSEYIITTTPSMRTPAPWINVLANPQFGSIISESGQSYTWSANAHEFRLTPWSNDSVTYDSGEAFYLRDESSGRFWSPMPFPCNVESAYVTRHGFGYSVFSHSELGIASELTVYVAHDAPVKFYHLSVRNDCGQTCQLSATGYIEWVLGDLRAKSSMHVVTEIDPETGALLARNSFNADFANMVTFFDAGVQARTITGDRKEFVGRNGTLNSPAAMGRTRLSGKVGAGIDPCAAIQVPFTLLDGETREIVFQLGATPQGTEEASQLIRRFRVPGAAALELAEVRKQWRDTLDAVQVETPDPAVNFLANGWLVYQTLSCRLWGRSGHYQSGGAFGFRDQLQDVMALVTSRPDLTRAQLLLCAAHQFVEGDVQHWWHPPSDRGVRTRCSDDYLWLPFATCHYLQVTGDTAVLEARENFLETSALGPGEQSKYDLPTHSAESATLYEHCRRAILRGLNFGAHGLPLMGSCDWNDGMDKVGEQGAGESVWLGFFLSLVLKRFAPVARAQGDGEFAARCEAELSRLHGQLEANGWDGAWYRRAYFDDGTPLGSASNPECQIDSIAQSWSVLSGVASTDRAQQAMHAVDERLIRKDGALIQLLDPPFDTSALDPGYIRAYVPGVRENGGQYTHAGIWTAMAFSSLQDEQKVGELLHMLNPVHHGDTPEKVAIYKVEPYVMAADIYTLASQYGRGGWTWYTGSAGWMYRFVIESVLGMRLEADVLFFKPCLPPDWNTYTMRYRYRRTTYVITAIRATTLHDVGSVTVDGTLQVSGKVQLVDDQRTHAVQLTLPATRQASVF